MKKIFLQLILILCISSLAAQINSNIEQAVDIARQAYNFMNDGNYKKAIEYLDSAYKLDTVPIFIPYEKAVCLYKLEKYSDAIKILSDIKHHPEAFDRVYQVLGNSFDFQGKKDEAVQTYNEALEKFPYSGRLYMELGIIEIQKENGIGAINFWETGVAKEPMFPENYYYLAKYFSKSPEKIWTMIYGEIYFNLGQSNTKMTDLNKIMYELYNTALVEMAASPDSSMLSSLNPSLKKLSGKLPFRILFQKAFDISSLDVVNKETKKYKIQDLVWLRKQLVNTWFEKEYYKLYDITIMSYLKKLIDDGQFEAYNYYFFKEGALANFLFWKNQSQKKITAFADWLNKNHFTLDSTQFFTRQSFE